MNTTDENKDSLAALYAMGALDESERHEADLRYESDPEWRPLLTWWQQRLDPLTLLVKPVTPPSAVWEKIQGRIDAQPSLHSIPDLDLGEMRRPPVKAPREEPGTIEETIELWRQRTRFWQAATLLSVVSIASIAAILVFKPMPMQQPNPDELPITVAVLQNEQNAPVWAVSLRNSGQDDSGEYGELVVTVVGDTDIDSTQSHQMWMVLKDAKGVQSVGLLPDAAGEVRRLVLPRPLSDAAELAVSLEAKGGVPGPEHGPVVTRTFVVTPNTSEAF